MKPTLLTDLYIKNSLQPTSQQYEVRDTGQRGLSIRVSPGGSKAFYFSWRDTHGKNWRYFIGRYPDFKLAQARNAAIELRARVARGDNPRLEKKSLIRQHRETGFADLARSYWETECSSISEGWKKEIRRILSVEFVPRWGNVPISQITKGMVRTALSQINTLKGPSASEHALAVIRRAFNLWVQDDLLDASPCKGLKSPGKSKIRQRALTNKEIAAIWRACDELSVHQAVVVKACLATAGRRNEVAGLRHSELDLEDRVWRLPHDRNKSRRDHLIPLSAVALEVLASVPKSHPTYVFPAVGSDNAMSGFSKWKRKLVEVSGVTDWCLHDLRRTAATHMAALKVAPHVIELILNHQDRSRLAKTYNTHNYEEEKREALELWGEHLRAIVSPDECSAGGELTVPPEELGGARAA